MPRRAQESRRRSGGPARRLWIAAVALGLVGVGWALQERSRARDAAREVALAEDAMARGDLAEAVRILEEMPRRGLDPLERRIVLAVAYGKANDPRALDAAKAAAEAAPDSLRAHMALLSGYARIFDKPNVVAQLAAAQRLAPPGNTELCLFGARYGAQTHDYRLAEEQARRCVAVDPRLAQAWYYLGLSLAQSTSRERWAEAETSLETSVLLAPDFHPGWLELGHLYVRLSREADAVASLERARSIGQGLLSSAPTRQHFQDVIRAAHLLGKAYRAQGRTAEEVKMRRECDALNERMQRLPAT
jgi:tetratricopeptide (TPR) repeat protein